jgi:hypothetical protein
VPRTATFAALFALDQLECVEQLLGAEIGTDPDRGVEEVGLVQDFPYRLGAPG